MSHTRVSLSEVVRRLIALREETGEAITLLAVCPNSTAVLEAGVRVAAANNTPMLFAATLNQVDRDGGYTGWTQASFAAELDRLAGDLRWNGPLYPCLDHGGPWLKDAHTLARLTFDETMAEVKRSLTACLEAGYDLLHVDPTVDRTLPPGSPMPIDLVASRTLELIAHAEAERERLGLPAVSYEVGTEEVHGGLADLGNFDRFLAGMQAGIADRGLSPAWPCFVVGKVGTDLHTAYFDPDVAQRLTAIVTPLGSLIKGHYTDGVANPEAYPASGMGGANVGPEFTIEEHQALVDLCAKEDDLCRSRPGLVPSGFAEALENAVLASGRWQKWLQSEERGMGFRDLLPERRRWLVQTGARYVWTKPEVVAARRRLYGNVELVMPDPHGYVVDRIARAMDKYVVAFHLFDANRRLGIG